MPSTTSTILAFETSCDETAVAVVRDGRAVLSNVIASQHDLHAEYRGVVPEIASRAHAERITPVLRRALADAGVTLKDITAVGVGNRPGLIGSLLVGVASAKALAWSLGVPIIGVDHVHAHLLAGLIGPEGNVPGSPRFPALGLVVSGGHTSLYLCDSTIRVRRIGATIDDAVGEAYDKVAAVLQLPFPGGPSLDKLAQTGRVHAPGFPIARIAPDSLDFSFSGLKTAALYAFRGVPEDDRRRAKRESRGESPPPLLAAPDVAATFQESAIGAIMLKLRRATERFPECRTLLVGGGVSANSKLRRELEDLRSRTGMDVRVPPMAYCLDNAAMIAALAHDQLAERSWLGDALNVSAVPTTAF